MATTLYAFPESAAAARRLASLRVIPCVDVTMHRFPDGESLAPLLANAFRDHVSIMQ